LVVSETKYLESCSYSLLIVPDLYELAYYKDKHFNWVGSPIDGNNLEEYFIVSVLERSENGEHSALQNSKKGFDEFMIPDEYTITDSKKTRAHKLEKFLSSLYGPAVHLTRIKEEEATEDILSIEKKTHRL